MTTASPQATLPLDGIRVLDLSRVLAGPSATVILADLGAEIIKIEEPGVGDITRENAPLIEGESHYFLSVNRSKKSVTINLKTTQGQAICKRLAAESDVVIENFRPGVLRRLGLDYEVLREVNPRLVMCSISGFGQDNYADRPAFDIIMQAMTGLMSVNGDPDRPPVRLGIPLGDIASGLFACIGIASALRRREIDGKGCFVDVSMYRSMVSLLGYMAGFYFATGRSPERVGSNHHSIGPMGPFEAKDGSIVLAIFTGKFWRLFCEAIGHPELADDPRFAKTNDRVKNMEALRPIVTGYLRTRTVAEWEEILVGAGVPNSRLRSVGEVLEDPFTLSSGMIQHVQHPVCGELPVLGPVLSVWDSPEPTLTPPPLLGEHTDEILSGLLGLSSDEVAELVEAGVVTVREEAGASTPEPGSEVQAAVRELSSFVEPDGGRLELRRLGDERIELELLIEADGCSDCILPKAHLEAIALKRIAEVAPRVRAVDIIDGRELVSG